ncbi:hypothetical protein QR680_012705 [Steinernema hermaphroditum]|uniref:R3H domain-containing protein n=1 Tax=Steinernema hermaphroditum TaxID=289476 RepID=A0AA39M175_9BILA|nr:hypothetical protein QR680_012705 [Steinernema hermaphroditum]
MLPKEHFKSLDGNGKKKQLVRSNAMCGDDDNRLQASSASASRRLSSNASSRDSAATDYTDTTGINLVNFFRGTLHKSPKDRQLLLDFEKNLQDFIRTDKQAYKFPAMCSYNRMLLHRVSAYFGLDHNVDQSGKAIVVNKTDHTRIPNDDFRSMIRSDLFTDASRMPRRGMQSFDDARGVPCTNGVYGGNVGLLGNTEFASRRARSFDVPDLGTSPVLYQQPVSGSQYSICSNSSGVAYAPSNVLQIVPQDLNESVSSTEANASLASPPIMESPAFAFYQRQQYGSAFAASFGSSPSYPMAFAEGMMFSPPTTSEIVPTSPPCQWSNGDAGYATSDQSAGSAPDNQVSYRSTVFQKFPDGTVYFYPTVVPTQQPQSLYYQASPDQLAQQIGEVRLTNSSSSSDVATGGDSTIAQPSSGGSQPTYIVQATTTAQPTFPTIGSPEMCYGSPPVPVYYQYYQQAPGVLYPVVANGYAYQQSYPAVTEALNTQNGTHPENETSKEAEQRPSDSPEADKKSDPSEITDSSKHD